MAKKETLSYRERLRALIEAEGLSIEAFAQAIGRSPDTARGYLKPGAKPKVDVLVHLARTYPHWSLKYLALGEEPMHMAPPPTPTPLHHTHRTDTQHWLTLKHTARQELAALPLTGFPMLYQHLLSDVDLLLKDNEQMAQRLAAARAVAS